MKGRVRWKFSGRVIGCGLLIFGVAALLGGCGWIRDWLIPSGSPVAVVRASATSGQAPLEVIFDASGSYHPSGRQIVACAWTFGDGAHSQELVARHVYRSAGTFEVALVVTDDTGKSSTSRLSITATKVVSGETDASGLFTFGLSGEEEVGLRVVSDGGTPVYGITCQAITDDEHALVVLADPHGRFVPQLAAVRGQDVQLQARLAPKGLSKIVDVVLHWWDRFTGALFVGYPDDVLLPGNLTLSYLKEHYEPWRTERLAYYVDPMRAAEFAALTFGDYLIGLALCKVPVVGTGLGIAYKVASAGATATEIVVRRVLAEMAAWYYGKGYEWDQQFVLWRLKGLAGEFHFVLVPSELPRRGPAGSLPPQVGVVSVDPPSGQHGTSFSLRLSNWQPRIRLGVVVFGSSQAWQAFSVETDGRGQATAPIDSANLVPGMYTVQVDDPVKGVCVYATLEVTPRPVQKPNPPRPLEPGLSSAPGPVINTLTPTFRWEAVSGAERYGLYIRDLATDTRVFDSQERGITITGTSYSMPSGVLEWGKSYRWNMNSYNTSGGWGDYSERLYFQVASAMTPIAGQITATPVSPNPAQVGQQVSFGCTVTNTGTTRHTFFVTLNVWRPGSSQAASPIGFPVQYVTLEPNQAGSVQWTHTFREDQTGQWLYQFSLWKDIGGSPWLDQRPSPPGVLTVRQATHEDRTPPTVPTGLRLEVLSSTQINLAWNPSTDNVGVARYEVFRNGSLVASVLGTSFTDTALSPGTRYCYVVRACDAAGNCSGPTGEACTTTTSLTRTLTVVSANPNTGVAITVSPVDNQGRGGGTTPFTLSYNSGTVVTLAAPATAGGNSFQKWQREGVDWATTTTTRITVDADYTVTAVYASPAPPTIGTIHVNATLDGQPWPATGYGFVEYRLAGPQGRERALVPETFPNMLTGLYTLTYLSGGPSNALLASIAPSPSQTLTAGGTITFTLHFRSRQSQITGRVVALGTGQAILDALVEASGPTRVSTTTDSGGYYALAVTPGTYTLTASAPGYQAQTITGVVVPPGENAARDFALAPVAASQPRELIVNGSFTSGDSGWTRLGDFWAGADPTNYPNFRTPPGYAAGGVDWTGKPKNNAVGVLYQTVTIPAGATRATLSSWYNVTSEERYLTAPDVLFVSINDSNGNVLEVLGTLTNLDQLVSGSPRDYRQLSYDVTRFRGQTVQVCFAVKSDPSNPTVFRIDDVSLMSDG